MKLFKKRTPVKPRSLFPITAKAEGNTLILERLFASPRELVYQAFTEEEQLKQWWGPKGWTLPVCSVDLRPGGSWHYCLESPDGKTKTWGKTVYRDIQAPDQLVYEDYVSDEEGKVTPGTEILVTLSFEEHDGKTMLVNRAEFASEEALKETIGKGLILGMEQTWDRLAEHLENMQAG